MQNLDTEDLEYSTVCTEVRELNFVYQLALEKYNFWVDLYDEGGDPEDDISMEDCQNIAISCLPEIQSLLVEHQDWKRKIEA